MGNLTRDPELRYIPSGLAVTDIGLAVNDRKKNAAGDWIDETTFVDITLWGRTAEIVSEYLSKGSPLFVEGRLKLDTWETDGQKRSKLKVIGERIQMLGSRGGDGGGSGGGGEGGRSSGSYSKGGGSQSQTSRGHSQAPQQDDYDYSPPQGDDVPF